MFFNTKRKIVLFFSVFVWSLSYGQTIVSGTVESSGKAGPLEYAEIVALKGKKPVGFGVSDENGVFALRIYEDGEYAVTISYTGYESKTVNVICKGGEHNLGLIKLRESKRQLAEAKVTSRSPFKLEADRLVYDVTSDPEARKINMSEFMSKIPGLGMSSSSGKLEYKDMLVSTIEIDGKRNIVINAKRQYPMEFIKADHMKTIELIFPGSPEYSNSSPVLLIKLKKDLPYGIASEVTSSASSLNTFSISPDIVAKTSLISTGINYRYAFDKKPQLKTRTERTLLGEEIPEQSVFSSTETSMEAESFSHSLTADFEKEFIDNKLNVQATLSTKKQDVENNRISISNTSTIGTTANSESPFRLGCGLLATYSWNKANKMTLRYTHLDEAGNEVQELRNETWSEVRRNISTTARKENNASAWFQFADKKPERRWMSTFELGIMERNYNEDTHYWDGSTGGLKYDQTVSYLDARYMGNAFDRKMNYSAFMRGEYIVTMGEDSFILSPSASLSFLSGRTNQFIFGYGCLSKRPGMTYLRSFTDSSDPNNITTGNPLLTMQTTHSFNMTDNFRPKVKWINNCRLSLEYSMTSGAMDMIETVSKENIATMSYRNLKTRNNFKIEPEISLNLSKSAAFYVKAFVLNSEYVLDADIKNSLWTYGFNQSFDLRCKAFDIRENFSLYPYATSAQVSSFTMRPELGVTISKYWKKLRIGGSLSFNDVLSNRSFIETTYKTENALQHTFNQVYGRYVSARVYWRMGRFRHTSVSHSSYDM